MSVARGKDSAEELVASAVAGDRAAMRSLIETLTPVIQMVIGRCLVRCRPVTPGATRQEVADLVQETFVALLDNDCRALRQWSPARGRSLTSFVGLIAEREVYSTLRSRSRNPWTEIPVDNELAGEDPGEAGGPPDPETLVVTRDLLAAVVSEVRERLGEHGVNLFFLLIVEERAVEEICEITGMTTGALYAWHSRLRRLVRRLQDPAPSVSPSSPRKARETKS